MREYYLNLDSCFRNGLRPTKGVPKNSQYMCCLLNGRPSEVGLEPYIPVVKDMDYIWDWPFPQLFVTNKHRLLGLRNSISIVDDSVSLFDSSDAPWDVMSYYDYIVACKTGSFVGIRDTRGTWTKHISSSTFPMFATGCDYKGQAVVGNLRGWTVFGDYKPNFIAASNIGSFDFTVGRKNVAMYRPVHWNGEVLCVRRLDDTVWVYGDNGIAYLYPKGKYLGYKEVPCVGVLGKGAVGSSLKRHVFLGTDYKLRSVDSERGLRLLDFSEYMEQLNYPVAVSYRQSSEDFFISDGVKSFVLVGDKLYECYQLITSCGEDTGVTPAAVYDTTSTHFLGVTDVLDFGLRGMKTITTIGLGITGSGYSVALDWRSDTSNPFIRTPYVNVNSHGVVTLITTAVEFRLCIRCADFSDLDLSYATIRYKMTDMRSIRGVYAPPPRGQDVS